MKKYIEFEMTLITILAQDIVTMSPFDGDMDEFGDPNANVAGDF